MGETENIIKVPFSLVTIVAPSIIFIDEADSMFHKRRSDDADFVRSRVNTFQGQTDRLLKAERPPFLLLATNHPNELDEAVLCRVPMRLYIGLPTQPARKFDNNAVDKVGYSYSVAEVAKRKDKSGKKAPHTWKERGTVNQAPNWMEIEEVEIDETHTLSFDNWKKSDMYPYVTEELCQHWWQQAQE